MGIAAQHRSINWHDGHEYGATDWQLGLAGGDGRHHTALAYRWSTGDDVLRREKSLVLGHILRPGRGLALGLTGIESLESDGRAALADLSLRPLGSPLLTLFADYALTGDQRWDDGAAGLGLAVQPVPGLRLGLRAREREGDWLTTWSLGVTLDNLGLGMLPAFDADGERTGTTWLVETDPPRAPLSRDLMPVIPTRASAPRIAVLDLENKVLTYQKPRLFDDTRIAWLDLQRALDAVRDDPQLDGVAVNLAGLRGRPSLLWELRERLADLRARGKTVDVHIDRAGMLLYPVAAAADRLTIDPEGGLELPGIDLSRTYLRGLLDKLGLGFEALQYFDHKTAVEVLSRTDMSPADREQRGRIADVIYECTRAATVEGRGLTAAAFDAIVDGEVMLSAQRAVALGLADSTARWHDLAERLQGDRGAVLAGIDPQLLRDHPDDRWGRRPAVAVVFAVGECAMDTGIKGRSTAAALRALIDDPDVKAVVLRADSPGGDPLPSDLVAGAVRALRDAGKPVVVSQGDVAASGGYWISMNGTEILTTPVTITGSVGVIAGWLWDQEMHEKAGVAADGVARGLHADMNRAVRYPIGFDVPARPLTPQESAMARERILEMYDRFVAAVAAGRGLDEARVREIGGGRVWMGADAVERGLCDGIGGLGDAIARARELAGIAPGERVRLLEVPRRPLLELPKLGLPLPGLALNLAWPWRHGAAAASEAPVDPGLEFLRLIGSPAAARRRCCRPTRCPRAGAASPDRAPRRA
ncbi:MAG: S49 family peptidase [bacterium]|nr:S49 family peptidase [bacterium]